MTVVAVASGGAAPGATTSAAVLSAAWPGPVVLADCDPTGGQIAAGWLAEWLLAGQMRVDAGLVSFVAATRHAPAGTAAMLEPHLQPVPPAPGVRLLAGLRHIGQSGSVDEGGWRRTAQALGELSARNDGRADTVVDCGRLGPGSPWPVLWVADVVLVAVRPVFRSVLAARAALAGLGGQIERERLGLLVCASSGSAVRDVQRALGVPVRVELPFAPHAAAVYSDGALAPRGLSRSVLVRSARTSARRLAAPRFAATESARVPPVAVSR